MMKKSLPKISNN